MNRIPRLSDKELIKWVGILGAERIQWLYVESKIYLTQQQLDKVIEMKKEDKKEGKK